MPAEWTVREAAGGYGVGTRVQPRLSEERRSTVAALFILATFEPNEERNRYSEAINAVTAPCKREEIPVGKFCRASQTQSTKIGVESSAEAHQQFSEVDSRFKLVDGTQRGCSLYLTATQASDISALRRLV